MSFSHNPYRHFEFIVHDDGSIRPYCHSCGKSESWTVDANDDSPLSVIIELMAGHVFMSHKRTPEDFKEWSIY